MKKRYKFLLIIVVVFIGIQFYGPYKNSQKGTTVNDFLYSEKAPRDVANLIINSCYDCHSNFTKDRWYSNIAPASWLVGKHVKAGKYSLNFSNWAIMDVRDKRAMLSAAAFNITKEEMPLKSYLMMHPDTRLSQEEIKKIMKWLYTIEVK
ncbi:MAG: heme-binding domain-containing protein [Psychroserpens sp.]|uniref:heme-binding domain-containing protein n=1 Tax=Psychroserpens sp. TaxID=2020870 RepID=UPI00300154AD